MNCPAIWEPYADFHFYPRNMLPILACIVAAGLWFFLKVGMALVQAKGLRTWATRVFHARAAQSHGDTAPWPQHIAIMRMAVRPRVRPSGRLTRRRCRR